MTLGNGPFLLCDSRCIWLAYIRAAAVTLTEPLPQRATASFASDLEMSVHTKLISR